MAIAGKDDMMATKTPGHVLAKHTKDEKSVRGALALVEMLKLSTEEMGKSRRPLDLMDYYRKGVEAREAFNIWGGISASNTQKALALGMSERTLARLRSNLSKRLSPTISERIVKIAAAKERAVEVFEDSMKADKWLTSPSVALGGRAPLDLMQFDLGIDLVMKELGRIEHGVIS